MFDAAWPDHRSRTGRPLAKWPGRTVRGAAAPAFLLLPLAAWAQDAPPAPPVAVSLLPQDLSPWGMVAGADWVVQAVIAGLAFASVLTWTVALAKGVELLAAGRSTRAGLAALRAAGSLDEAGRRAGRGAGVLATVGATTPFVGLFGTVWGIMNAFVGISRAHATNLAVVAPGIAEALLATAAGLVAAIPAVVIYNLFARAAAGHKARLADAAAETMRLLSRDLDRAAPGRLRAVGD